MLVLIFVKGMQAQYISEVLEYKPAPGQFINSSPWGIPASANSLTGNITGSMSLGAFGGYVVFKFENPVENHPDNPFGIDFTIFGNPLEEWSEHGIVSVMKDDNGNGLPDDTWYELAGSEYFFSSTMKGYEVTYTNPGQDTAANVPWTDNQGNSGLVLANGYHHQPYYPLADSFPAVASGEYVLSGTKVADEVDRTNSSYIKSYRKAFGYVDNQLRGAEPYTVPDNPYTPEKENSGGDAFDIGWAVNGNGEYVDLDVIHFVKVHNAVLADAGWLGEVSTEITGAVDVVPDNSLTGVTDIIVLKDLPDTVAGTGFQLEVFAFHSGRWDEDETISWSLDLSGAEVHNNLLTFTTSGKLTIIASLAGNPSITASDSTILVCEEEPSSLAENSIKEIKVYPNPASESIFIEGIENARVSVYSITGEKVLEKEGCSAGRSIPVGHLPDGIYIIKVSELNTNRTVRFIRN